METAVEWLIEQLSKNELFNIMKGRLSEKHNNFIKIEELLNQAQEMELSQLVECWNTAHQAGRFEGKGIAEKDWQTFETYWEETFK